MLNSNEVLYGNFPASRRFSASHNGIDLAAPNNTGVKSRFAGVVKVTGTNPVGKDFGNYIRVYHPQLGISSWYAHLLSFGVKVGQSVSQGQLIGQSNNTGVSTGPHLHYGESKGETLTWIDPDLTQGGEAMTNNGDVYNLYRDVLGRPNGNDGDAGSLAYVNKPFADVYYGLFGSSEAKAYRASQANVATQAAKVPNLEQKLAQSNARIAELEAQAADTEKTVVALKVEVEKQAKEIADLTQKLQDATSHAPTPPNIEGMIKAIILWIKGIVGGGEK